jgi:hypothetical protein
MEISRTPGGLPPLAREEVAQRQQNARGGEVGGDPTSADRQAALEWRAADAAAARAAAVQTSEAVGRPTRPDLAEPGQDALAQRPPMERGARLDLRI